MKTLGELFGCWESDADLADDTGLPRERVKKWRQRGVIPNKHWSRVMDALKRKGKKLSADDLLVMHARRVAGNSGARVNR